MIIDFHTHVYQPERQKAVALRQTTSDGIMDVYFCHYRVAIIDLGKPK